MEKVLGEIPFCSEDDRDEASYLYRNAALAIRAWKCHLLRTVRQYQARFDTFDLLDEQTVLLVNDWAIKFIPQKHRESQADWFGKREISWCTSAAYRKVDQQLQSCIQGSAAVVAILQHIIQTLKLEHPEIERVFLRQDNSGCYHSASTNVECTRIEASTGVKIEGLDFSDPQGGKGAADRLAAAEKSQIRMFINEGNDVTDAQQIKDAFLSHGGIEGVRVAVSDSLEESTSGELPKIAGISKLNNFRLTGGKLTAWRAYAVGKGKLLELTTIPGRSYKWWIGSSSNEDFKDLAKPQSKGKAEEGHLKRLCREDKKEVIFPAHKMDASGCFKDYQTLNDTCHLRNVQSH